MKQSSLTRADDTLSLLYHDLYCMSGGEACERRDEHRARWRADQDEQTKAMLALIARMAEEVVFDETGMDTNGLSMHKEVRDKERDRYLSLRGGLTGMRDLMGTKGVFVKRREVRRMLTEILLDAM